MTRNVSDTTKRIRALAKVERIKAEIDSTGAAYDQRIDDIKRKHKARIEAKTKELESARADYKALVGEDCPI